MDNEHYGHRVEWNLEKFRFKAVLGDKIVGTISGKHEGGVVYIDDLIVSELMRGQGVGRLLIKEAEMVGKKYNAHKIQLITGKGWKANEFYKKLGFSTVAILPNHHFHKDFIVYHKLI